MLVIGVVGLEGLGALAEVMLELRALVRIEGLQAVSLMLEWVS